jgi:hypothetical protein
VGGAGNLVEPLNDDLAINNAGINECTNEVLVFLAESTGFRDADIV